MKSNCCLSTLITRSSDEGTSYYECKACGEPCDVAPQNQPPLDTGHHAEYEYKKNRTKRESEDNFISKTEHEKKIREAEEKFAKRIIKYLDKDWRDACSMICSYTHNQDKNPHIPGLKEAISQLKGEKK